MRHLRPARRQLTSLTLLAARGAVALVVTAAAGAAGAVAPFDGGVAAPPPKNLAPAPPPPPKNLAPAPPSKPPPPSPKNLAPGPPPKDPAPLPKNLAPAPPPPPPPPPKDPAPGFKLQLVGDSVELRAERGGVVARIALATPPSLRRGAPVLRAREVEGHQIAELRQPVRGRPGEEVWIGDLTHVPARVIWSGIAGPRDADEETAVWVEVTTDRIFEFQTAAQVSRCDGEAVRLFTRAWDFSSEKFRPILSPLPPLAPPTQKLIARRDDPVMPRTRPMGGFHFTSASTTAAAGSDAGALSAPSALDDGDPRTVWAEGLGGDGRGEFLTARASAGHYRVRGLRIVPGDASTAAAFKSRNRLKSLAVALGPDPARRFDVEFPEDPAAAGKVQTVPYWIAFPAPVDAACLTLVIRDVYRGTERGPSGGGGTTAISDVQVFTELDDASGVQRLVSDMATGKDCPSRVPLLVALGEAAVSPAAQAITKAGVTPAGRECLVETLSRIEATDGSAPALEALAAALVGGTAREERLVAETLRRAQKGHRSVPVAAVAALLPMADPATKRAPASAGDGARAARVLAELDRLDAAAALLGAAGAGAPEARLAVVQGLARSPATTLPMLTTALEEARGIPGEASSRRQADLIRVLPALAGRTPADRGTVIDTLRRALATGSTFEVRARGILALGQTAAAIVDDEGTTSALASDLAVVRERSDDPVLRFLATRELGSIGGPAAAAALRNALTDRDPRVREAAAQGMASTSGSILGSKRDASTATAEEAVIDAAKNEPWPFARRAQLEALARTCGGPARDLLARAMERDVDEVRRAALVGLVRCRDKRARSTLLATLKNRRASASLRELSGAMLGELGDRSVTRELADIVAGLVNEAEADLAIESVVMSAVRSLARLGGPDAATAAARMAGDARHPAYRRVAVEALGQLCDPGVGAKTLAAVRSGGDASLADEARKAQQRCP